MNPSDTGFGIVMFFEIKWLYISAFILLTFNYSWWGGFGGGGGGSMRVSGLNSAQAPSPLKRHSPLFVIICHNFYGRIHWVWRRTLQHHLLKKTFPIICLVGYFEFEGCETMTKGTRSEHQNQGAKKITEAPKPEFQNTYLILLS